MACVCCVPLWTPVRAPRILSGCECAEVDAERVTRSRRLSSGTNCCSACVVVQPAVSCTHARTHTHTHTQRERERERSFCFKCKLVTVCFPPGFLLQIVSSANQCFIFSRCFYCFTRVQLLAPRSSCSLVGAGALKMWEWKMQEWKMREQTRRIESQTDSCIKPNRLLHFPPLRSAPAFSTLACWPYRIFHSHIFSRPVGAIKITDDDDDDDEDDDDDDDNDVLLMRRLCCKLVTPTCLCSD